ncbi:hypothetical protein ZEAMMB73_Zm00001d053571 [Zea mays]|uniref:Uncharacterized protein n=1 Tax=Zea mays TaxID=4577 RepID=A0A1D6QQA8_MAIZE|nr:hypothetical protein ZEAMMB73_Zm00001d053571 [Zea mays]
MMRTIWSPDGPNKIHPDVDLTAPDAGRPDDDPAWFCLRVGCDQSHERVDPEALDRSFFMRVMAARSPNVRLQRLSTGRTRGTDNFHLSWMFHLRFRFIVRILILTQLDAEMPALCAAEASETSRRPAARNRWATMLPNASYSNSSMTAHADLCFHHLCSEETKRPD